MQTFAQPGHARRPNPFRIAAWTFAGAILALPLVAMQFTEEVDWNAFDFIFAGLLIGGTGALFELTVRLSRNHAYRAGVALALAAVFLLVWITGAVGIIGSEDNPANLMFGGVIALALLGSIVVLFRPAGMAWVMGAAAFAQFAIGAVAVAGNMGATGPIWPIDVIGASAFFTLLWLGAAGLFRMAAHTS